MRGKAIMIFLCACLKVELFVGDHKTLEDSRVCPRKLLSY